MTDRELVWCRALCAAISGLESRDHTGTAYPTDIAAGAGQDADAALAEFDKRFGVVQQAKPIAPPVEEETMTTDAHSIWVNMYPEAPFDICYAYWERAKADRGMQSNRTTCIEYVPASTVAEMRREIAELKHQAECNLKLISNQTALIALKDKENDGHMRAIGELDKLVLYWQGNCDRKAFANGSKDNTISKLQSEVSHLKAQLSLVCSVGEVQGSSTTRIPS